MYTSGTTGFPKGALLTHSGLVNNAVVYSKRLEPFAQREELALQELGVRYMVSILSRGRSCQQSARSALHRLYYLSLPRL